MRSITLAGLLLLGLLAAPGCKRKDAPVTPAAPRTMPIEPSAPMHTAKPDEVRVRTDLAALRGAIQTMQQSEGKTPASLDQLGIRINFPDDLVYDPNTGQVRSKTYPMY